MHFKNMVEDPSVLLAVKVIFKTIKIQFEKQETQIFFVRYYSMKMPHCACVNDHIHVCVCVFTHVHCKKILATNNGLSEKWKFCAHEAALNYFREAV